MIDKRYLVLGLNALSRAHEGNYFVDGHRSAAILAAHFLCAEEAVEDGVPGLIAGMVDECWGETDLCAPFPTETADPSLLPRITGALAANMTHLRQAGHNVIFPSLALKAFHQIPETITPSRVDGICRLIEAFDTTTEVALHAQDVFPDVDSTRDLAEFALREYLRSAGAFLGRGQGWTGHMLTFGRALVDLDRIGYGEVAQMGHHEFRLYVKRARMGPLHTDKPRSEHPQTDAHPLQRAYWERRRQQDPALGHCFKYPYGLYGLLAETDDPDLKRRCLAEAFRVF